MITRSQYTDNTIILCYHGKKSTINVASVIRKCLARVNYEFPWLNRCDTCKNKYCDQHHNNKYSKMIFYRWRAELWVVSIYCYWAIGWDKIFFSFFRFTGTLHVDQAFQSVRVEPVTTCIPPDGEERLSQEERSSSFFCCYWRNLIA